MAGIPRPFLLAVAVLVLGACGGQAPSDGLARARPGSDTAPTPRPTVDATAVAVAAASGPWRRVPTVPSPAMADAAEDACRALADVGDLPLRVSDTRGQGLLVLVFADDATAVVCEADVPDSGAASAEARVVHGLADAEPPAEGHLGPHDLERVVTGAGARFVVVGRVADVPEVGISFDDWTWGKASLKDGWYAAWWPQAAAALSVASVDRRSVVIDSYAVEP
jgi:hypothetical protein